MPKSRNEKHLIARLKVSRESSPFIIGARDKFDVDQLSVVEGCLQVFDELAGEVAIPEDIVCGE